MSAAHEQAVPQLHVRMHELRLDLEDMTELARELALALDAEVDLRHGERVDDMRVKLRTSHALNRARGKRLL